MISFCIFIDQHMSSNLNLQNILNAILDNSSNSITGVVCQNCTSKRWLINVTDHQPSLSQQFSQLDACSDPSLNSVKTWMVTKRSPHRKIEPISGNQNYNILLGVATVDWKYIIIGPFITSSKHFADIIVFYEGKR